MSFKMDGFNKIQKELKDMAELKNVPVKCPHCNNNIKVKKGSNTCPSCNNKIDVTFE